MNIVLLTAAGIGSRMGQDIPKQFIHVNDKPVLIYTMEAFERHPLIDAIMVVTLPSWLEVVRAYAKQFNISKLKWVEPGGASGPESIYIGIQTLSKKLKENDNIMIHDGDRCNISSEIISNNLAKVKQFGSAVTVIPCSEAVFKRKNYDDPENTIEEPRNKLYRIQTPYTYNLRDLMDAYKTFDRNNMAYSAPCLMMQQMGKKIYFSQGSEENLKITTIADLNIFKALLNSGKYQWTK